MVIILGALLVAVAGIAAWGWSTAGRLRRTVTDLGATAREQSNSTQEIIVARAQLQASLNALDIGIVVFGELGEVFRNAVAQRFAGARHANAIVEDAMRRLAALGLTGESASDEQVVFGPPAQVYLLRCQPLGADEKPTGAVVWMHDVTDARRLDDVRRDFVANVSHELRTPIGALALLAETIVDEPDPVVVQQFAQRIVREAERLARIVDDLLDLSVIEANPPSMPSRVPICDVVNDAVAQISNAALVAQIPIHTECIQDCVVLGDRRQLVSAVYHLLENAVKYSSDGAPISVSTFASGDDLVRVDVRDSGIGIPTRDLERVFERFYRVDRARSRDSGGTGLGLSIVRHIASAHGGSVSVVSHEGEGSTFTLRLPVAAHSGQERDV